MGEPRPASKDIKVAKTLQKEVVTANCKNYRGCIGETEQNIFCIKKISKHQELRDQELILIRLNRKSTQDYILHMTNYIHRLNKKITNQEKKMM